MKKRKDVLFINKTSSTPTLSRSTGEEELQIRQFIQRGNRRRAKLAKDATSVRTLTISGTGTLHVTWTGEDARVIDASDPKASQARRGAKGRWKIYTAEPPMNVNGEFGTNRPPRSSRSSTAVGLSRPVAGHVSWSRAELRGFQYFSESISSKFNSWECMQFWQHHLPRAVEHSTVIRSLVTALALMHECYNTGPGNQTHARKCKEIALAYCNNAMARIRESASNMSTLSLDITCILIVTFEILRGNYGAARACMESGLAISGSSKVDIIDHRWQRPVESTESLSANRSVAVIKAKMVGCFVVFNNVPANSLSLENMCPCPTMRQDRPFENCYDVNSVAEVLYSKTIHNMVALQGKPRIERESDFTKAVLQRFSTFHYRLSRFRGQVSRSKDAPDILRQLKVPEMKVNEALLVLNCIVLGEDEMAFDQWTPVFDTILDVIDHGLEVTTINPDRLMYHPFSAVFVPSLWLTASRCREPTQRRRAIALLNNYRRREVSHDSFVAAKLAEQLMIIEERGLPVINCCSDVPRSSRIELTGVQYVPECRQICMEYSHFEESTMKYIISSAWIPWEIEEGDEPTALNQRLRIYLKYSRTST